MDDDEWRNLPVHQRRERLLRAPQPDDDNPVILTVRHLLRVQQAIAGTLNGDTPRLTLAAADRYLMALISESGRSAGHLAYTATQAWEDLDRQPLTSPARD